MASEIKILVHSENEVLQEVTLVEGQTSALKAQDNVTYELRNLDTNAAPEELVAKRNGDNLELYTAPDAAAPIATIEGYFLLAAPSPLVGMAEGGDFYPFVPQSGEAAQLPWNLEDGDSSHQSLGYDTQGSAVPWWPILLAGLLLLGGGIAAASKSSSSGGAEAPPVKVPSKPEVDGIKNGLDENGSPNTTVTGEATPGDKVVIKDKGGNTVGEADVEGDGSFTVVVQPPLEDGEEYDVTAEDKDGNTSEPEIIVGDTTPPDKPSIEEVKNNFDDDGDVESTTITGKAEPGSTVEITDEDGKFVDETTADKDGNFEITVEPALVDGEEYEVTATDDYNNTSEPEIVVGDQTPPSIDNLETTQVDTSIPANDEPNHTIIEFKTDDPDPEDLTIIFTNEDGDVIEPKGINVGSDGKVTAVFEPALKANEKVTVTATDPAGNSNDKTDTVPDFIGLYSDNEAPNAPVIDEISHDKTSTDDNEHTTVIKGNVQDKNGAPEVGATVVVTDKDGNSITDDNGDPITATTDEDGDFEIELPLLDEDEHSITATDKAGNESNPTDFIVDYTPPAEPEINIENGGITNNADDTTTIKGNVKNGKDGSPEEGATVVVKDKDGNPLTDEDGNQITTTTDEDGDFEITVPKLDNGEEYEVTATDEAGNESDPAEVVGDTNVNSLTKDAISIGINNDEWITEDEIINGKVTVTVALPDDGLADDETLVVIANGKEYPVTEGNISGNKATIYVDAPGEGKELEVEAYIKDDYSNQSDPVDQKATQDTIGPDITDVDKDDSTGVVTGKTEPGATIVDSNGDPIEEDGNDITAGDDGNFTIPADKVPTDGVIKAQDEAGNTGNAVNVNSLPAVTEALDFVEAYIDGDKQERDSNNPETLESGAITNDNRPLFEIPTGQNVNEGVLIINGVAVEAEKVERDGKTYLQPKDELTDGEYSVSYTTDASLQESGDVSNVDLDKKSNDFTLTLDTTSPDVEVIKQESINELVIKVDEDAEIEIFNESGDKIGTGKATANQETIIELNDGITLTDGDKVNVIATDKAGNQGTLGNNLFEVTMDRTLAVNNNEELVLELTPTAREADENETTEGTTVRSFGAVSAGLGGAADAGVLDFANNAINIKVAEGTERKLDLYAGGGGISIADFYDLVVFKEDAYGNTKYYDYYDDWFAVPFLGMTKEGSITINEPGNYHIMLVAKGGVKAIGGTELKVIKDTVIDYNDYESASGRKQGNMMTDPNFLGENDELGEDIFVSEDTTVTSVTYDGVSYDVPSNKSISIEAEHGILKVFADGSYNYTLKEGAEPSFGDTERFEYTITNEKTKESSTAELNISLVQTPSTLVPDTTEILHLAPKAELIEVPSDMALKGTTTWGSVAGIGLGPVADVGLITVENGLEITVGENQVRDVSFSGTTGAPIAVGYNPVDFVVYKKEVTPNGEFWQEYLVVEDWFGMIGAVIGAGQSSENMDLRLDEGEYKVMLHQHMGGISVAPTVQLHVKSDELYEYQETKTKLDSTVEFDDGYSLYSLSGIKRGAENDVEVEGKYGTLTMQKDGSYTYELFSGFDSKHVGEIETFHYSVVNSDGRIKTSTLNIVIDYVQANDDTGNAYFGMDNIEAYEGWSEDLRTTGSSTKTYSKDISVGENQIFDLNLSYDINQIGTVLGGANNYTIRLKDKNTGEIIETHLNVNGSKGVKDTWDLHLTEGEYTVEVLVSPRAANQQNVKLNLSGTVTSLDHFQTEESNHQIEEGNLLDNDYYKESTGAAEFAHLEVNGKPIDIVVNGDFNNNMYKSITLNGEHGTLTVREDGSYTYEAHGNSYGIDEFDYKLISINGSSSSAKLVFNAGMNITGSQYDDIITGSDGSDTLRYELLDAEDATGGNGTDTWTDFHIGDVALDAAADQIDLSKLLEGVDANNANEYLKVEHNAADNTLTLSIDRDGAGSEFDYEALLVLENQTDAIDLEDLLNNQQIIF